MSHSIHYRSFPEWFLQARWSNQQCLSTKETSWSSRSGLNPTRTTPPYYNNTTLGNCLYAQHKGPNVTNPICCTRKKINAHISVLLTVNIVPHNPTQSSSDNIPLNHQTIIITGHWTRCCLAEGRDDKLLLLVTVSAANFLWSPHNRLRHSINS